MVSKKLISLGGTRQMYEGKNLVAIVSGGSSGIGLATIQMLRDRGYVVVSLDVNPPADLSIPYQECNVALEQSVENAISRVAEAYGGIDVVVNCAAISTGGDISINSDSEWAQSFDVNVIGIARICRHALAFLRRSSSPVIVNVASIASHRGIPNRVLYSATKGAVLAMTLAMASDFLKEKIRVNAVAPGTADTPWVARLLSKEADPVAAKRALEARQPIGRLITADEIALAICYLVDPRAGSTTGVVLDVDGGMHNLSTGR
jgi:NAD(P)-dependent dehydrogenase (short-subunit alcohol dehydrogenase family)